MGSAVAVTPGMQYAQEPCFSSIFPLSLVPSGRPSSCSSPPLGLLEAGWVTSLPAVLYQFRCVPESPVLQPDLDGS